MFLLLSALNQYDKPIMSAAPAAVGTKNSVDPASTLLSSAPDIVAATAASATVVVAAAAKQAMAKRYFLLYFMYLLNVYHPCLDVSNPDFGYVLRLNKRCLFWGYAGNCLTVIR